MNKTAWIALLASVCLAPAAPGQEPALVSFVPEARSYRPTPGDILLFRNDSIVMNALAACTLSVGTTHTGIVVKRRDGSLAILETPYVGADVQFREIDERIATYRGQVWVRHPLRPLSDEQSAKLTEFAYAHLGKGYDYLGFLALPVSLPIRLQATDNATSDLTAPSRWFCSSLAVAGCCVAGQLDPSVAYPRGACADDLRSDLILDLRGSYGAPLGLRVNSK